MSNLSNFLKSFDNSDQSLNKGEENQKLNEKQESSEFPEEIPEQKQNIEERKAIKREVIKPQVTKNVSSSPETKKPIPIIKPIIKKPTIIKKPIINKIPKNQKTNIDKNVDSSNNIFIKEQPKKQEDVKESEEERQQRIAEELFVKSETPIEFKEQWMQIYKKGLSSVKKTMTSQKVKNGRFRLDNHGEIEILADFDTYGKTSKDLLRLNWQSNN